MIVRGVVVVILALLLAAQVVRDAAVAALAPLRPTSAAKFWAGHPSAEISLALAEIGAASRDRKPIDPHVFRLIDDAVVKSPLAPEPFLVRGVQAQIARDADAAKAAFLAAQWRDPRSMPAAYFLASYYLGHGALLDGLKQTTILARLSPNGRERRGAVRRRLCQGPAQLAADARPVPIATRARERRPFRARAGCRAIPTRFWRLPMPNIARRKATGFRSCCRTWSRAAIMRGRGRSGRPSAAGMPATRLSSTRPSRRRSRRRRSTGRWHVRRSAWRRGRRAGRFM